MVVVVEGSVLVVGVGEEAVERMINRVTEHASRVHSTNAENTRQHTGVIV